MRSDTLHIALLIGHVETARALWADGAKLNFSDPATAGVLIDQAVLGRRRMAELLLEKGADPNAGWQGTTPLIAAARRGDRPLVETLLARRARPNQADATGLTPLMAACQADRLEAATALLAAGANAKARTTTGDTAAHFAAALDHLDLLKLLCEAGADPAARNAAGDSPLVLAVRAQFVRSARFLAERGARLGLAQPSAAELLATAIRLDLAPVLQAALADGWPAATRFLENWPALQLAELSEAWDCATLLRAAGATLEPGMAQLARPFELTSPPAPTTVTEASDPRPVDCSAPDVTVDVEFVIERDGRVIFPRVRHCPDPRLSEPSLKAIRRWRFAPAKRGEVAVATRVNVPLLFRTVRDQVMAAEHVDTPPMLTSIPEVPETAQRRVDRAFQSGQARVFVTVGLRGEVETIHIESEHSPAEKDEMHRLLRDMTFTPGMRGGVMVRTRLSLPALFMLQQSK